MPDSNLVSVPGRKPLIAAAVAIAVVVVAVLMVAGALGASGKPSCSSYPTPGTAAPAGTRVPASLADKYAVLTNPQRGIDRLRPEQLSALSASGLIMSGTRFLGDAAYGGRVYLVPAEHMLAIPLAPPRCLSRVQRVLEQESLPLLRGQYRQRALCLVLLSGNGLPQNCTPAVGTPYALLDASGTPAYGLVPNGVSAVTITYQTAAPRIVPVHRNFFAIVAPSQTATPCGVQWLAPTGSVQAVPLGCSYLAAQTQELYEYRAYVAGKLSTLRSRTAALAAAIARGNLAGAESAWLAAHLTWLAIGQDDGAYGAFGALGGQIDGLAAGHPLGTADPGFTGFHRIEFDLWTRRDLRAAASDTATLERLLADLIKAPLASYLPATKTGIGNWLLRPHEVIEDALRDSLTANDDYGSGTDLASITADVAAVRVLLSEIAPGLVRLAPGLLPRARAELNVLMGAVDAARVNGAWVSVQDLPTRQRQQVDADVGAALETLAPIPDVLTSTGNNAPGD